MNLAVTALELYGDLATRASSWVPEQRWGQFLALSTVFFSAVHTIASVVFLVLAPWRKMSKKDINMVISSVTSHVHGWVAILLAGHLLWAVRDDGNYRANLVQPNTENQVSLAPYAAAGMSRLGMIRVAHKPFFRLRL